MTMLSSPNISATQKHRNNDPFVSVLMPVRNEAASIRASLSSVLAQDYASDRMEVIVADGLSTDRTREIVSEISRQHANITLIDNPGRIVATGLNAALHISRGEIIVRVDGHCEIAPDYISSCRSHLLQDNVECVGGPLETIGETYTAQGIAAAMSSGFGVGGSAFRVGVDKPQFTDTVAFPAYKRETLRRVGAFDEELIRNQDDEYNYRLRSLGGRVLLSPDVRSRYYSRTGIVALWKQFFQYGYWKVRVLQKHPRQMKPRQFIPPLFVFVLLMLASTMPVLELSRLLLVGIALTYAALNFTSAITVSLRKGLRLLPLIPIAFIIMHIAYGAGFLCGLVRFWHRWALAVRAEIVEAPSDAASL